MATRHATTLLNKIEQKERPVLPDLGASAEEKTARATCDQWGHVCSARPGRACCGQCERSRSVERQPNDTN